MCGCIRGFWGEGQGEGQRGGVSLWLPPPLAFLPSFLSISRARVYATVSVPANMYIDTPACVCRGMCMCMYVFCWARRGGRRKVRCMCGAVRPPVPRMCAD